MGAKRRGEPIRSGWEPAIADDYRHERGDRHAGSIRAVNLFRDSGATRVEAPVRACACRRRDLQGRLYTSVLSNDNVVCNAIGNQARGRRKARRKFSYQTATDRPTAGQIDNATSDIDIAGDVHVRIIEGDSATAGRQTGGVSTTNRD